MLRGLGRRTASAFPRWCLHGACLPWQISSRAWTLRQNEYFIKLFISLSITFMANWALLMLYCFSSFLSLVTSQSSVPEFLPLRTSSLYCLWGGLYIHDPACVALTLVARVWRAVHMAWADSGLTRCVEDPRSLEFPARSSNGSCKLVAGLSGSCLCAGEPESPPTLRVCRVLAVEMSWVSWAARWCWGLGTQMSSLQCSPAKTQGGDDSSYQTILLQV